MKVNFTQFLLPDGRKRSTVIEVEDGLKESVDRLMKGECRFEIEILCTGQVSMEVVLEDDEGEPVSLAGEIVENGPGVKEATEKMIRDADKALASS